MTCTLTTSPTERAAAAPASTAAFTLATSPVTKVVHNPLPTFLQPLNWTLAAFNMASVAHTRAAKPLVSIIPILDMFVSISFARLAQKPFEKRVMGTRYDMRCYEFAGAFRSFGACINRSPHTADISANHRGDIPAANFDVAEELHARSLAHGIAGFDHANQATGLD